MFFQTDHTHSPAAEPNTHVRAYLLGLWNYSICNVSALCYKNNRPDRVIISGFSRQTVLIEKQKNCLRTSNFLPNIDGWEKTNSGINFLVWQQQILDSVIILHTTVSRAANEKRLQKRCEGEREKRCRRTFFFLYTHATSKRRGISMYVFFFDMSTVWFLGIFLSNRGFAFEFRL